MREYVLVVRDLDKKVLYHQQERTGVGQDHTIKREEIRELAEFREGVFVHLWFLR